MEKFKIEHFEEKNNGKQFPAIYMLSSKETQGIYEVFLGLVGGCTSALKLVISIDEVGSLIENINANNSDFMLSKIFKIISIKPMKNIYINWYRFDDIDKMRFDEFAQYFDDIWYPGVDDIDMFDESFKWILSISHNGYIKYIDFEKVDRSEKNDGDTQYWVNNKVHLLV